MCVRQNLFNVSDRHGSIVFPLIPLHWVVKHLFELAKHSYEIDYIQVGEFKKNLNGFANSPFFIICGNDYRN